jgi:hypothetical protein
MATVAAVVQEERQIVFGLDVEGEVCVSWLSRGQWVAWRTIGPEPMVAVDADSDGSSIVVYGISVEGRVWACHADRNWDWTPLGEQVTTAIAPITHGRTRLLFGLDLEANLCAIWDGGTGWNTWRQIGWQPLVSFAAVVDGEDTVVYGLGNDDYVHAWSLEAGGWDWTILGQT